MNMISAIRMILRIPRTGNSIKPIITEIEIIVIDMIMEDIFGEVRILLAIKSPPTLLYVYPIYLSNEFACIE